ncbi:hypothetical protein SPBR_04155 [Sporothrix brasiliensis 5110]|uniref:Major facilitator superfamily (MFS) profile domain-containing protein n=1 Tax=Sporothrix brasiliensis 5110 TaxID=1398154 RepID=A0A0C2J9Z7_9PEZI|nr:uncharacterized protein SPBR_04155 [Sporothrix brasiliensis 5110]KIH93737.1 hypothetical protein SPBR_04155 [Sporothrix brasiliensis 5110]
MADISGRSGSKSETDVVTHVEHDSGLDQSRDQIQTQQHGHDGDNSNNNDVPAFEKTALGRTEDDNVVGADFAVADDQLPAGYFRSLNFVGSMLAIGLSFCCGVGGFSLIAPVLGIVNADIGPDPNLTWVSMSYLLTSSIGLIVVGRVTDIFGRRWWFVGGNAMGTLGAIVCAAAPTIPALIAGETLIGAYVFVWSIPGSGLAPAISYAFIYQTKAGWRGIFYFLIALNAITTVLFYVFYHPPTFHMKHASANKQAFIKHFDYLGIVLVTLGLLLFLMGISWGGTLHPWKSAAVVVTIVLGLLTIVAFVLWETYGNPKEPMMPIHVFRHRGWNITIVLWSLGAAAIYYANAILWPSMVAALYSEGHSRMWAGWMSCIPGCGILAGEFCAAAFRRKTNWQIMAVFPVGGVLLGVMATSTPDTVVRSSALIFFASFFIGWNELLNSTVATISIQDQREIGTYAGTGGSSRSLISTVCSTIYTTVLSNRLAHTIPAKVPAAVVAAGLPERSVAAFLAAIQAGTATAWDAVAGLTPEIRTAGIRAYQDASASAYSTVFLTTIAFSGLGSILAIFAPNVDHLLTKSVNITVNVGDLDAAVGVAQEQEKGVNQSAV